jgi:hypothetical protein
VKDIFVAILNVEFFIVDGYQHTELHDIHE